MGVILSKPCAGTKDSKVTLLSGGIPNTHYATAASNSSYYLWTAFTGLRSATVFGPGLRQDVSTGNLSTTLTSRPQWMQGNTAMLMSTSANVSI